MSCGIYKITNKAINKVYIGQSVHIEKRWAEHLSGKGNQPLYEDIYKNFNINNFTFEILEFCEEKFLNEKEEYWIKYYNAREEGYNIGGVVNGKEKEVFCYSLEGEFLASYKSVALAAKITKINSSNISACCLGKTNRAGDFQWSYEKKDFIEKWKGKERKLHPNWNAYVIGRRSKAVDQYSLNNEWIATFNSMIEAERITGVHRAGIGKVCNGQRATAGGFIWKFKNQ